MLPQAPSSTVAPESTAHNLLSLGFPFVEFPKFSIREIQQERDIDGNLVPFSEWLTKALQVGKPFVIRDFDKLEAWPKTPSDSDASKGSSPAFTIERLIELSTKKNIPIRNCSTGRDLQFTLSKFVDSARQSYPEFQNLYARDLQCPPEWLEQCRTLLPIEVQWGGRLDLFQWLPQFARSEVMMAYVGSEGSCSGFHRCFSSTVALNFLVDTEDDRPVVCIGTDFDSQTKYDAWMSAKGVSPHLDWHNLGADEMKSADFPLYVYDQKVGDLVILPPATAHQIWNPSTLSTKLVWNTLHPLSLEVGIHHVQPPFNRLCHPDVARTNLSLAYAMLSLAEDNPLSGTPLPLPPDLPLLSRLFRQLVHDESIESSPIATDIQQIQLQKDTIATCNFCNTAIWNRHVRCTQCTDFDLCLLCYLNGRSCDHAQSYVWAELVPIAKCNFVLNRAREILGFQPEEPRTPDRQKTLGTAVNDLMKAKEQSTTRLCHLCRIDHPDWKGRRCDSCTAFFCYRGLYRHFDVQPTDVIRHSGIWDCPKCQETCNCRCCHFVTAYVKNEKPANKRRVKAADPRGKAMGFADNVFDQKRGGRRESAIGSVAASQLAGKKRPLEPNGHDGPSTPLRKIEMSTPEPDTYSRLFLSREGSDYPNSVAHYPGSTLPPILPGVKAMTDVNGIAVSPNDDRTSQVGSSTPRAANEVISSRHHTLPPMLPRNAYDQQQQYPGHTSQGQQVGNLPMYPTASSNTMSGYTGSSFVNTVTNFEPSLTSKLIPPEPQASAPGLANITPDDSSSPPASSTLLDKTIQTLESQIRALRSYDEEFVALKLDGARKMLNRHLDDLESQLEARKRERGVGLVERLKREGFDTLADAVGMEIGLTRRRMVPSSVGLGINQTRPVLPNG